MMMAGAAVPPPLHNIVIMATPPHPFSGKFNGQPFAAPDGRFRSGDPTAYGSIELNLHSVQGGTNLTLKCEGDASDHGHSNAAVRIVFTVLPSTPTSTSTSNPTTSTPAPSTPSFLSFSTAAAADDDAADAVQMESGSTPHPLGHIVEHTFVVPDTPIFELEPPQMQTSANASVSKYTMLVIGVLLLVIALLALARIDRRSREKTTNKCTPVQAMATGRMAPHKENIVTGSAADCTVLTSSAGKRKEKRIFKKAKTHLGLFDQDVEVVPEMPLKKGMTLATLPLRSLQHALTEVGRATSTLFGADLTTRTSGMEDHSLSPGTVGRREELGSQVDMSSGLEESTSEIQPMRILHLPLVTTPSNAANSTAYFATPSSAAAAAAPLMSSFATPIRISFVPFKQNSQLTDGEYKLVKALLGRKAASYDSAALSFKKGDIIHVLHKHNNLGLWVGQIISAEKPTDGPKGHFPFTLVQPVQPVSYTDAIRSILTARTNNNELNNTGSAENFDFKTPFTSRTRVNPLFASRDQSDAAAAAAAVPTQLGHPTTTTTTPSPIARTGGTMIRVSPKEAFVAKRLSSSTSSVADDNC
jgi:hypothetical protein